MATISKSELNEASVLKILKYKTHPDLLGGVKEFIDPIPLGDFVVEEDDDDRYIQVTYTMKSRLDLISYVAYGSVWYWWVIAAANNIFDPWTDLRVGDQIRIPTLSRVLEALRKYRKKDEE